MLDAVTKSQKIYHRRLHEAEIPTALQTSVIANQNRDPKKQKPFGYEDFSVYKPKEDLDLPEGRYGAAMLEAIRLELIPSWALFCYKELASSAKPDYAPSNPILVSCDAVLLHPSPVPGGYEGLLIAREAAGNKCVLFKDCDGTEIRLNVPHVSTKVVALEDVTLKR